MNILKIYIVKLRQKVQGQSMSSGKNNSLQASWAISLFVVQEVKQYWGHKSELARGGVQGLVLNNVSTIGRQPALFMAAPAGSGHGRERAPADNAATLWGGLEAEPGPVQARQHWLLPRVQDQWTYDAWPNTTRSFRPTHPLSGAHF